MAIGPCIKLTNNGQKLMNEVVYLIFSGHLMNGRIETDWLESGHGKSISR